MRTRQEIKAIGRERFKANYWACVLAAVLVAIVIVVLQVLASGPAMQAAGSGQDVDFQEIAAASGASSVGSSIGSLLLFLLTGPLTVGLNYFYIVNVLGRDDEISVVTPFRSAFSRFGRKLGGYLWMELFLFLWSLLGMVGFALEAVAMMTENRIMLLIGIALMIAGFIPAIVKTYSYAMTPYFLADCSAVRATDALKLSKRVMSGHKWEFFVMQLSFLGWILLSVLTLGLLDLFYVGPYMSSSFATYYLEVREEGLRTGTITMGQLEGKEAV